MYQTHIPSQEKAFNPHLFRDSPGTDEIPTNIQTIKEVSDLLDILV